MMISLPPAVIFILGGALIPLLGGRLKQAWMLFLPLLGLAMVHYTPIGTHWTVGLLDYDLVLGQVDKLSKVFGYIFCIISFIAVLFALQVKDDLQHSMAFIYSGAALGVTFAGDFLTLYIFWELMAIASTFVILCSRTAEARKAAFRYVLVHLAGGLFLLGGIILRSQGPHGLAVAHVGLVGVDSWLIFIGIAVNAAVVPLHPWLKDAYPQATATGAVFLSAFTTKSAVYVMARTFAGTELLIWMGAIMTVFPIFYAVLENDIRRVLSYSLINQVGFMMCGIGIGTQLALNGTVSHAFAHILYKALLFMSAGAVLTQTGKIRCTDLGGLYKYMPFTAVCCMIASASISAFPLFSGFVSKSMIISAAGYGHLMVIWLMLQFASAGVVDHAGIKVPFFMFFGHDSGLRPKEAPINMRIAMGIAAAFCIGIGVYPDPLYSILPFPVDYVPYTGAHVVGQFQLLLFGALAFCLLMLSGMYPAELRAINLDFDWFYRIGGKWFYKGADLVFNAITAVCDKVIARGLSRVLGGFSRHAPSNLAWLGMAPLWTLTGSAGQNLAGRKKDLFASIEKGASPVGVSAAMAVLVLFLVLILS